MIFEKGKAIFESIVSEYKRYIELGVYKDGDRLPSVRSLASDLGINPNTVQKAYSILEDEGYISTLEKKGVYVTFKNNVKNDELIKRICEEVKKLKENGMKLEEVVNVIEGVYHD